MHSVSEVVGEKGIFIHCWWERKTVQSLWKGVWHYLTILHTFSHFNTVIPLVRNYSEDTPPTVQKDIMHKLFTTALFIITNYRKLPKYSHWRLFE